MRTALEVSKEIGEAALDFPGKSPVTGVGFG